MKIKAYANWEYMEVISEAEFIKKVEKEYNNITNDSNYFSDWLNDNYKAMEIWNEATSGDSKWFERIKKDFEEEMWEAAKRNLTIYSDWNEVELEV